MDGIIYASWGLSWSMLVEEAPAHQQKVNFEDNQAAEWLWLYTWQKVMAANFQLRIWLPKFQPFSWNYPDKIPIQCICYARIE